MKTQDMGLKQGEYMRDAGRRVVTGHDANGNAIVTSDGPPPTTVALASIPGTVFHELWSTDATPARVGDEADPTMGPLCLPPPPHGTRVRVVDIPPDTEAYLRDGAALMQHAFAENGDAAASTVTHDSPHPLMHRTETVDYGFVLDGEITLVLDRDERQLKQGDVVVQRGTNHAWANRSGRTCRMAFVLVDGRFDAGIPGVEAGR